MKNEIKTKTTIIVEHKIEIDGDGLIALLRGEVPPDQVPHDAKVYVRVPGGGDWSNTDLSMFDDNVPIIVEWSTIERKDA